METKTFFTGSYGEKSIGLLRLDERGRMSRKVLAEQSGASYLAYCSERQLLYALTSSDRAGAYLHVYRYEDEQLRLLRRCRQSSPGACHLAISREWLLIAYYKGGAADIFKLDEDGLPEERPRFTVKHEGGGPEPQQDSAHIHWVYVKEGSPDTLRFYLIDLGNDSFCEYFLQDGKGPAEHSLRLAHIVNFPPGSGPRHAVADEARGMLYVLSELDSRLYPMKMKDDGFMLKDAWPLRAEDAAGESWGGAIRADDAMSLLFCSNRGDETIRCFDIRDGLRHFDLAKSSFKHCRDLRYASAGDHEFLLLANLKSDCISLMDIDRRARRLTERREALEVPQPACICPAF